MPEKKVWQKGGPSPNKNGRPRGTRNPNTPHGRLERALKNGYDLVDLKDLLLKLIENEDKTMSAAQVERLVKTAVDLELNLLKLDFDKSDGEEDKKGNKSNTEEDDEPIFKLTAD
jgi:hypothetical protein